MSKALRCYVPCINIHSLVPVCLGQGPDFWPKSCPFTTNASPSDAELRGAHRQKAARDPKYIVRRGGSSGAVAVCFISPQGIPAFPSLGPAALRSLHLPRELPVHPWVSSSAAKAPARVAGDPLVPSTGSSIPLRGPGAQGMGCHSATLFCPRASDQSAAALSGAPSPAVPCPAKPPFTGNSLCQFSAAGSCLKAAGCQASCRLRYCLSSRSPHKGSIKAERPIFALWLLRQKNPRLLPGKLRVGGGRCGRGGEGKHLAFPQMHGAYVLLFTTLDRLRGRNDF